MYENVPPRTWPRTAHVMMFSHTGYSRGHAMQSILKKSRVPIKLWAPLEEVESGALEQLLNTANLPCVFKHVAVMPDVHYGIGATVGSVVATQGAIVPAAVGVDIGCGMMAAQLPFTADRLPDNLHALFDEISRTVPVGQARHRRAPTSRGSWEWQSGFRSLPPKLQQDHERVACQLGTLGGGNHFIEVCLDTDNKVWVMLHSGSRGIGNKIGTYYIDQAKRLAETHWIRLTDPNLASLPEGTDQFESYWRDLQWAQAYALDNRTVMMASVLQSMAKTVLGDRHAPLTPVMTVNCHHNYAAREHHFGEQVIVTRKGAVKAGIGDMGIIPGSMGARSYIVRGKGNPESFCSCSHGAGRRMSRGKAKQSFTLKDLAKQTEGVLCRKDAGVLDEIPGAYKNVEQVLAYQDDLVEVVATLKQVLCIKG